MTNKELERILAKNEKEIEKLRAFALSFVRGDLSSGEFLKIMMESSAPFNQVAEDIPPRKRDELRLAASFKIQRLNSIEWAFNNQKFIQ